MISMTTTLLRLSLILGTALAPTNQVHAKQCDVSLDMLSQDSKDFLELLDEALSPIKLFPVSKYSSGDKHKRIYVRARVSDKIKFNERQAQVIFTSIGGLVHHGPRLTMKPRSFKKPISEEIESRLAEIVSKKVLENGIANLMFVEKNSAISMPDAFNSTMNLRGCAIHQIRDDHIQFTVVMVPKTAVGSCLVSGVFAHFGVVNLQYLSEIDEQIFRDKKINSSTGGVLYPFLTRMYGGSSGKAIDISKNNCGLRRDLKRFDQELERQFQEFKRAHPEIKLTD